MRDFEIRRTANTLNEIIDSAAFDVSQWQQVMTEIARGIPGTAPALVCFDSEAVRGVPMIWENWDKSVLRSYEDYYCTVNPYTPLFASWPILKPMSSERTLPSWQLGHTEFYNDWMRPAGGIEAASTLKLVNDRDRSAWLIIHYDVRDGDRQTDIVEQIMGATGPNLRRALGASRVNFSGGSPKRDPDFVDAIAEPAMLVDATCRIVHANKLAEALIAARSPFSIDAHGSAILSDTASQRRFRAAIQRACSGDVRYGDELVVGLANSHRLLILPLRAPRNTGPGLGVLFQPGGVAIVVVREKRLLSSGFPDRIKAQFNLTNAEVLVCVELLDGKTPALIGVTLNCSYDTVRTHLKRIFAKTNTHRQAELVLLLRNLVS